MREAIGFGIVLPMVVAAIIVLPAAIRSCPATVCRVLGAAAVAGGFLAATFALKLAPLRPDADHAWHWLPTLAVVAAIGGSLPRSPMLRAIVAALLGVLAASLLVPRWPSLDGQRTPLRLMVCIGVFALTRLDPPAQGRSARVFALLLILIAASGAWLLLHGGTAVFAQLELALAMALVGITIAAHRPGVVSGVMPVVAVTLPGLLLSGCLQSATAIPGLSYLLIAAAPLAFALPVKQRHGWIKFTVVLAMLGMALGLAALAEPMVRANPRLVEVSRSASQCLMSLAF